jgi:hypothetical protein
MNKNQNAEQHETNPKVTQWVDGYSRALEDTLGLDYQEAHQWGLQRWERLQTRKEWKMRLARWLLR